MPPCFHSSIQNSPLPPALQAFPFSDILTPYASVAQLVEQVTLNHMVDNDLAWKKVENNGKLRNSFLKKMNYVERS
jgi:hypothetical protein